MKPHEPAEIKTTAGIILKTREDDEKRKNQGVVIATPEESPVSVGCMVLFKGYAGQEVWVDEKRYLVIEFQDLCGVLL